MLYHNTRDFRNNNKSEHLHITFLMRLFSFSFYLQTNYSSYQNTLGRCSTGPYSHLNKFPYHSDVSAASQYGYNSWGVWKDSRNLTPSLSYSSSKHNQPNGSNGSIGGTGHHKKSVKSFTILLMTAAFIVMLAVLSVAGLAFYFSTFKSDLSDCK